MRKWLVALVAVMALSVGVVWGESKTDKAGKVCPDNPTCCCCNKSCPK